MSRQGYNIVISKFIRASQMSRQGHLVGSTNHIRVFKRPIGTYRD
jgi:hypothetical protein